MGGGTCGVTLVGSRQRRDLILWYLFSCAPYSWVDGLVALKIYTQHTTRRHLFLSSLVVYEYRVLSSCSKAVNIHVIAHICTYVNKRGERGDGILSLAIWSNATHSFNRSLLYFNRVSVMNPFSACRPTGFFSSFPAGGWKQLSLMESQFPRR